MDLSDYRGILVNASVDNGGKSVPVVEHLRFADLYLLEFVETARFIAPVDRLSVFDFALKMNYPLCGFEKGLRTGGVRSGDLYRDVYRNFFVQSRPNGVDAQFLDRLR